MTNLPHGVTIHPGQGGLECIDIDTPIAKARIYRHGAHLAHWEPAGQNPVIWMSSQSLFAPEKPIRGGVPVCFPWFGPKSDDPKAPPHGFARLNEWAVESVMADAKGAVLVTLGLSSSEKTRSLWPFDFKATMSFHVGTVLIMELAVRNTGPAPFTFEEALHTYFAVSDVRNVRVTGLAGTSYLDKTDQFKRKDQGSEPITITGETDRVYLNTRSTCTLHDPGSVAPQRPGLTGLGPLGPRRIKIAKSGSDATVIWNPWIAKAKAMPDFGDDEWPSMICIETVNAADHKVTLTPCQAHTLRAELSVEKM